MTGAIPGAKPLIADDERAAVDEVLAPGGFAQCPQVEAFEQDLAEVVGGREWVAVNSGTSALNMALIALGIADGDGDELIVPSFTFPATANTVALAGTTPVFVDIEEDSLCIKPEAVKAAITSRTKAVMPAHLYGHAGAAHSGRGPRGEGSSWVS